MNANAFEAETRDATGTKIKTCDTEQCVTMPNPRDLQGLQVRQTLSPERQILFYSKDHSFMCSIRQGQWLLSLRVVRGALPITKVLEPTLEVVAVECANEQEHRTTKFFVPAVEYVPAIVR